MTQDKEARDIEIFKAHLENQTMTAIGAQFGITTSRVGTILQKWFRIFRHPRYKEALAYPFPRETHPHLWVNIAPVSSDYFTLNRKNLKPEERGADKAHWMALLAMYEGKQQDIKELKGGVDLRALKFLPSIRNPLYSCGIHTIDQLVAAAKNGSLKKVINLGAKGQAEVIAKLKEHGLLKETLAGKTEQDVVLKVHEALRKKLLEGKPHWDWNLFLGMLQATSLNVEPGSKEADKVQPVHFLFLANAPYQRAVEIQQGGDGRTGLAFHEHITQALKSPMMEVLWHEPEVTIDQIVDTVLDYLVWNKQP